MTGIEPYRPSNGTEGDIFRAQFCDRCTRQDEPCEILGRTLWLLEDDPNYPTEWVCDVGPWPGNPRCTAFVERQFPERRDG